MKLSIHQLRLIMLMLMLSGLSCFAIASGQTEGERILDSANNFKTDSSIHAVDEAVSYLPGGVLAIAIKNTLANSLSNQDENKKNALNQNVEIDVAKKNLENSKENISTMFSFIVDTFIVLFDVILSIVYIVLLSLVIWIIFVGYVKLHILIIDFIHGKIKDRGENP